MSHAVDVTGVRRRLKTVEIGCRMQHFVRVGSTNDVALGSDGPSGLVVVAEQQELGRGRHARRWSATPMSSLLVSVLLRWPELGARLPGLTLASAVAVCSILRPTGVDGASIKWPNDVLSRGRKIAGILSESRVRGATIEAVVIGIGLNVNQSEEQLPGGATSIAVETGLVRDRDDLLVLLLERLERELLEVRNGRFDEVRRRWEELAVMHRGHGVRAVIDGAVVEGVSDGLDMNGALGVRLGDGSRVRVLSGEVTFL